MGSSCSSSASTSDNKSISSSRSSRKSKEQSSASAPETMHDFIAAPVRTFPPRERKQQVGGVSTKHASSLPIPTSKPESPLLASRIGRRSHQQTFVDNESPRDHPHSPPAQHSGANGGKIEICGVTSSGVSYDEQLRLPTNTVTTVVHNPLHQWREEDLRTRDVHVHTHYRHVIPETPEDAMHMPPSFTPLETSGVDRTPHSASRHRSAGSPSDSGVASRLHSNTEYSGVQLLDALAMDLVSDHNGGSAASNVRRGLTAAQPRRHPKLASVLSVSSPDDDVALELPYMDTSMQQQRQAPWIAAGGTAGVLLQHHGVPGGVLSDGVFIPAAYQRSCDKDAPSLTMNPRHPHDNQGDLIGDERDAWTGAAPQQLEPAQQQIPLDLML